MVTVVRRYLVSAAAHYDAGKLLKCSCSLLKCSLRRYLASTAAHYDAGKHLVL